MSNNKKLNLLVCIILFVFVLLPITIGYTSMIKGNTAEGLLEKVNILFYIMKIVFGINSLPMLALIVIAIIIKSKFSRLDKNDLKKYEGYYRDIIDKYSVAALSYIDSFKVDDNILVATLMDLERKNIIECTDKIKILNDDVSDLTESEKFIMQTIKIGTLNKIKYKEFEEKIIIECINNELLKSNKGKKENGGFRKYNSLIYILLVIGIVLGLITFVSNPQNFMVTLNINFGIFQIYMMIVLGVVIAEIVYSMLNKKVVPYVRTKKAKEINEKLEGLKNYIKDFSNLDERDKEALTLWNEYLIYSVMFGQNYKIVEEYIKKFL